MAVHDGVDSPVEETILGAEASDPEGTRRIVAATALVCRAEEPHVRVLAGAAALATPLGAWHAQVVAQVSPTSDHGAAATSTGQSVTHHGQTV